ncbi:unnamed protein product [Cuscuta campestris]|uniref:Glucan endo-1,3-beta-D-glucosidase n=1 Tax=Cuscuta campestris TaxID=132261 RepID=A0A484M7R9_9ASTE|nr:unnamed protein product [Cuscuta campestris]
MGGKHGSFAVLLCAAAVLLAAAPAESEIGVNWGTRSLHKMSPATVVDLVRGNGIRKVKLFEADPDVLAALMGSGIEVMVGIPNEMLATVASSPSSADLWVSQNLTRYMVKGGVDIKYVFLCSLPTTCLILGLRETFLPVLAIAFLKYVAVGNEPFLASYSGQYQSDVLPAMTNIQQSLVKRNLAGTIKLVVPCNADAYESPSLPSQGGFRPELTQIMTQLVSFLNSIGSPFIVNIYPFLSLYGNSDFPQDYAFFEGTTHQVVDGPNIYYNAFDGNFDTLVSALSRIGYAQMPIVIGEVGWPTEGALSANLTAARAFNQGLVNRVLRNQGTPLRPGVPPMDVYLFSLLDEDGKSILPGNFERHWGIFSFDGQAKYRLDLGNGLLKNAKEVNYLPSRWCIVKPDRDLSAADNHFRTACSFADCTTLDNGGSCNGIGQKR